MVGLNSGELMGNNSKPDFLFALEKPLLAGVELGCTEAHFEVSIPARHYLAGHIASCSWASRCLRLRTEMSLRSPGGWDETVGVSVVSEPGFHSEFYLLNEDSHNRWCRRSLAVQGF